MAVRDADNILLGGGRAFLIEDKDRYELGYLQGEIKVEEQSSSLPIKESEGGTVTTLPVDKEVHFTCSLLECNLDTLLKLNPSATAIGGEGDTESDGKGYAVGSYQSDKTFCLEFWHKKRSGLFRCVRIFKAKVSGNFTAFLINQDNASPIPLDIVGLADNTRDTQHNIYEQFECERAKAPGGGW